MVFGPIVDMELESFRVYWNKHCVRRSHNVYGGIPYDLHEMPEFYGELMDPLDECDKKPH